MTEEIDDFEYVKIIEFDGNKIKSEMDFHNRFAQVLDIQQYYGHNRDALWDVLRGFTGTIIWKNSEVSKNNMGVSFEKIVALLEDAQQADERLGLADRFTYRLE